MFKINSKEIAELTCQLIKTKTVNPPGNEYLAASIVKRAMKKLGMNIEIREKEKGRINVIGKIGNGLPKVALISHMDVVPAGEGWRTNPFEPVIKAGKIFGRGALDNKGPFASCYAAIKIFLQKNPKFKGTIYFLAVADEERGSSFGLKWLLEKGFKVNYGIIPDGGMINEALVGEKGALCLKITSFGKQAHGSEPQLGINAIEKLNKLLLRLQKINFGKNFNPLFEATTLNIGQISGGEAPNIVPGKAEAKIDIRYPLGIKKQDILKKIKKEIQEVKSKDPKACFKIEIEEFKKPHLVPRNSVLVKKFLEAAKKLKMPVKLATMGGITVGKELFFSGIPVIVHSPGEEKIAHMANEYIKIKNLVKCAELYALLLEKLLL